MQIILHSNAKATTKLAVTLSDFNYFSKFFHCWKGN